MSFFVTGVATKEGGNLGGLAGADAHCQRLADAAGSPKRQWRAYLSAAADGNQPAINARDRIGKGPWFNSRGVQIASSLEDLHGAHNAISRATSLPETGNRLAFPHDILTGSNEDGTLASGDATCRNWTSTTGHAVIGHSDKQGQLGTGNSWNSAHLTDGCSVELLQVRGGSARFYCFAVD
ncbi:MAG: hypothetical protein K2Y23_08540 [Cyanobacteria bacterium]|nr:hypothetical protein [Cyanobacteriota bacterium]